MNINGLTSGAINRTEQSAVESQSGNADQDTPDLKRKEEDFNNALSSKTEGQDSGNSGTVVVDYNPNEPTLYLASEDKALGSPFADFPRNNFAIGGQGPSTKGIDSVLGSGAASSFSPEITNLDTGGIGPAVPEGGYPFDE